MRKSLVLLTGIILLLAIGCGGGKKVNTEENKEMFLKRIFEIQRMPSLDSLYFEHTMLNGIQYVDLDEGDGPAAREGDAVVVNYVLWLSNSRRIDNSYERNEPFEFTIGKSSVIQGWHEGITGMRVGDKRFMMIPAELGYGSGGRGKVPPNASLYFFIEVKQIK